MKWNNTKEKHPKNSFPVLGYCPAFKGTKWQIVFFYEREGKWMLQDSCEYIFPSYWMPFPFPPEEYADFESTKKLIRHIEAGYEVNK